jgi:hypothetical protein
MISLCDRASLKAAPTLPLDKQLRPLLLDRIRHYARRGLLDLTHLVVVQPGDTQADLIEEVGFTPLLNPLDGARLGSPDFHPWWDGLQRHPSGWFELIVTVGNSGFAFVLFIQDAPGADPDLLALCRTFAG